MKNYNYDGRKNICFHNEKKKICANSNKKFTN